MTLPYAIWQHQHEQDTATEARLTIAAMNAARQLEAEADEAVFGDVPELAYDSYPETLQAMREERDS